MRLLPELQRKTLLSEICSYTRTASDFLLPDCDLHIQVIPGATEGLYGWIAANYLLGGFDAPGEHDHGKGHHTYGFLDMGGASAQIAFAPNQTEAAKHAEDLKLLRLRKVNGAVDEYRVFVTTWLGFGVNQARERYVESLVEGEEAVNGELPDPCLPAGLTISTKGDVLTPDKINGKETHLIGTGRFEECLKKSYPLLRKEVPCRDEPCLLNGVHVPAIDFDVNHFVGVSEYWHTTHGIFEMGHKDRAYDFATYRKLVGDFCSRDWQSISADVAKEKWGGKIEEKDAVEVCFKANWIINMLHIGIGIPKGPADSNINGTKEILESAKHRGFLDPFQAVHKIDDTEVSWTLGKMVLYAASEVLPDKSTNLPVGFGSNAAGIPDDWQYAGLPVDRVPQHPNSTSAAGAENWRDTLFEGKTPRRLPGLILFLTIICIALFLLCGKDRRKRYCHRICACLPGGRHGRGKAGLFGHKPTGYNQSERLLEDGMLDPDDFELGEVEDNVYFDEVGDGRTGKTSGRATPRIRTPNGDTYADSSHGTGTLGGFNVNAMDRSGLIPRTESRERLQGFDDYGRKSRRGSPSRLRSSVVPYS